MKPNIKTELKHKGNSHKSVEKALAILMAFTPSNQEVGTVALSEKLGYHKSTVSRLLHVLENHGFVSRNPKTEKYQLGPSVFDIGRAVFQSLDPHLITIAQPHIEGLRDSVEESIGLEVMMGDSTVMAYHARVLRYVRVILNIGARLPVHVSAGAKAILAFSPPQVVDNLLRRKLRRFTPNTITDSRVLKRRLSSFRRQGFATDFGGFDVNIYAIGAPIFDHEKKPIAAIVIAGLPDRMKSHLKSNNMTLLLKETAAKISAELFYRPG